MTLLFLGAEMEEFPSTNAVTDITLRDVLHPVFTNQTLEADRLCLQHTLLTEACLCSRAATMSMDSESSPLQKGKSNYLATRWT